MKHTSSTQAQNAQRHRHQGPMLIAALLALTVIPGCAQIGARHARHTSVVFTPAVQPAAPAANVAEPSLASIINDQLQRGHYAQGEQALRHYLAQHPDDRAAQAMLHQLTVDPAQMLGSRWQVHVVEAGDSYSSLAARYLGDASLFLVLARYNHSTNPSVLQVGEKLHVPLPPAGTGDRDRPGVAAASAGTVRQMPAGAATETAVAKAARLQQESLALLDKGLTQQALQRLDEALRIDPALRSTGPAATTLRRKLVDSYHQRAIVLYRDQQLDQAIALWDRVLAIDPDFEPAVIYRARALELKGRLKQF
jgi:tetratricopeptide (TPR) repeat protein